MLSDPRLRLRILLRLMMAMAVISAAVNSYWWPLHARPLPSAAPAGAAEPQARAADAAQLELLRLRREVEAHPAGTTARISLARWLFIRRDFDGAEQQLALLKVQQPDQGEVDYWLSLVQQQQGKLEAARQSIQASLRLEPGNERFSEQEAEIDLAQGRSEAAARMFDACLKRQPDSYAALMGKAAALEQLYEAKLPVAIPEIVAPVRKAVSLQPQNAQGLIVLARMTFAYLQQLDAAEALAHRAIAVDPGQAEPYLILAEISLTRPGPESAARAAACARRAAELDPGRPEPLYLLGRALLRQNDLAGGIEALERSRRIQIMPQAVYQLSLAYARAGHLSEARYYSRLYDSWSRFAERRKLLLALLQHDPRDISLHAQLAELYASQGAVEPARNWALKGLRLRPQDARLRRLLGQFDSVFRREGAKEAKARNGPALTGGDR